MYTVNAMLHSLKGLANVEIIHKTDNNDVIAEYNGVRYTAIFNPFTCLYYVDDIYGKLPEQYKCPFCGETLLEIKGGDKS